MADRGGRGGHGGTLHGYPQPPSRKRRRALSDYSDAFRSQRQKEERAGIERLPFDSGGKLSTQDSGHIWFKDNGPFYKDHLELIRRDMSKSAVNWWTRDKNVKENLYLGFVGKVAADEESFQALTKSLLHDATMSSAVSVNVWVQFQDSGEQLSSSRAANRMLMRTTDMTQVDAPDTRHAVQPFRQEQHLAPVMVKQESAPNVNEDTASIIRGTVTRETRPPVVAVVKEEFPAPTVVLKRESPVSAVKEEQAVQYTMLLPGSDEEEPYTNSILDDDDKERYTESMSDDGYIW